MPEKKFYKVCEKRIVKNKFGENMCGAIGCCECGDMLCECPICDRKCDKPVKLTCYNVHCIDNDGNGYDVGVCSVNEDEAKISAVCSLREGRNIEAVPESAVETDSI